jgi:DNA invertase Pin-like site-specific DNA recombinase
VTRFLAPRGQLAGEFVEVESGGNHTNRPQLTAALAECRKRRAVLVIAKLDRLARNVHFISGLMNSDVEFVAVDMPTANRLTIHILAAVAEHEREMISQRTKAALGQAKARGTKLGNPRAAEAAVIARAAKKLPKPEPEVLELPAALRERGKGLRAIARELNRLNIRTPLGFQWHPWEVRNQLLRRT